MILIYLIILNLTIKMILISFFALIIASFISCVSYRLENAQSFVFTRSKCTKCQHNLNWKSLIPLFSYIFLKGKCYFCKSSISPRYILIEIGFLSVFLSTFIFFNQIISLKLILTLLIFTILALMIIIDLEKYYIPNSLQILLFIIILIYNLKFYESKILADLLVSSIIYGLFAVAIWGFFLITAKIQALGVDDIKFFFIAGFLLGLKKFLIFLFLSGSIGILFGLFWTKIKKDDTFPFAPAMCLACYIVFLIDKFSIFGYNVMKFL